VANGDIGHVGLSRQAENQKKIGLHYYLDELLVCTLMPNIQIRKHCKE